MGVWRTTRLAYHPDYTSPSGAAEIRLLIQQPQGEITHVLVPPSSTAQLAVLLGITEFFFVVSGSGRLHCPDGTVDEVVELLPGTAVRIPAGIPFQYDNPADEPLEIVLAVVPMWTPDSHQLCMLDSAWPPRLRGVPLTPEEAPPPVAQGTSPADSVAVTRLPSQPDHIAPDGSQIRLLGDEPRGGYAHCLLPPDAITQPVRHKTVREIWYVYSGRGELWRRRRDDGGTEEVVPLLPGVCADIPLGTAFQFRSIGDEPLQLLLLTMARWPGPDEAVPVDVRRWSRVGPEPTNQQRGSAEFLR
jgi:mannose-6-phosphate isomerase-like protein (cupin superfamily)